MTNHELPADPISGLLESAVAMHSLFNNYRPGGFTEDQALRLVAYVLAAVGQNSNGTGDHAAGGQT